MKKSFLTLALLLGLMTAASAQDRGLFNRGPETGGMDYSTEYRESGLVLPGSHGSNTDTDAVPMGTGTALLLGMGAAYLVTKKRREE